MAGSVKVAVRNGDLSMVFSGLQKFEELTWMPYLLTFRAGITMRKLTEQFEQFTAARNALFDKHGVEKPNPDGGENIKELNAEGRGKLMELLEVSGEEVSAFKMSEFVGIAEKNDGVLEGLTPELVRLITPILVDDVGL